MIEKMEIIKKVDKQGRVVLPKKWREKYLKGGTVSLKIEGEKIVISPCKVPDLTKFFDSVEVDLKSDLSDWKSVKRELHEVR